MCGSNSTKNYVPFFYLLMRAVLIKPVRNVVYRCANLVTLLRKTNYSSCSGVVRVAYREWCKIPHRGYDTPCKTLQNMTPRVIILLNEKHGQSSLVTQDITSLNFCGIALTALSHVWLKLSRVFFFTVPVLLCQQHTLLCRKSYHIWYKDQQKELGGKEDNPVSKSSNIWRVRLRQLRLRQARSRFLCYDLPPEHLWRLLRLPQHLYLPPYVPLRPVQQKTLLLRLPQLLSMCACHR